MYMSSLSDEWCRLAHKFSYRSPWHVHVIVLTNQLSRFLTKRYISVANAIWCDLYSGAGGWKLSKSTERVKPSFMNLQISHAHLYALSQAIGKISTKRMSFLMFSDRSICRFIFLYLSSDFFNMFFSYSLSPSPASLFLNPKHTHTLLCSKRIFQTSYIQLYCIEFDSIEIPTQTKAYTRFKERAIFASQTIYHFSCNLISR